jgi:hypothetical protein
MVEHTRSRGHALHLKPRNGVDGVAAPPTGKVASNLFAELLAGYPRAAVMARDALDRFVCGGAREPADRPLAKG